MRIRTASHLQSALDGELGWRIIELGALKAAAVAAVEPRQTSLVRACIPLAYAHWEGFIKRAATFYGYYLSDRNLTYGDLKPCFIGVEALNSVHQLHNIERKIHTASNIVQSILSIETKAVRIDLWPRLNEVGNLNFDMFMEIVEFLGLTASLYSTKSAFIDETLVRTRNKVAHGQREVVDLAGALETITKTVSLVETFKTDIEQAVTSQAYAR